MQIDLVSMAPTGEAIGRHEGMVVFVPLGLPGETVEADIIHRRRNFARARIRRVIRPAPQRVTPPCSYFGTCGGCQWQHADYAAQLAFKTNAVREQLTRIGKLTDVYVQPCLPSPKSYGYRNHTQFVLSPRHRPGYYVGGTKTVLEVQDCPILDESLREMVRTNRSETSAVQDEIRSSPAADLLPHLRELHLRAGVNTGERVSLFELDDGSSVVLGGQQHLQERVGDYTYTYSPTSFFQVNTGMAELLVKVVMAALSLRGAERVLDLCCGVGLFTLPISDRAAFVLGVESDPTATQDAALNLAGHANAKVITADVGEALHDELVRTATWDAVVLDPPRAGIERTALHRVCDLRARRIVYVSCDPATLARDARLICDSGYTIRWVQPMDMFPQTHHVETAAVFEHDHSLA
jgi:23S rRNA (uracil1939-C5)-methyltransferase